jgi:cell division protein FtsX
MATAAEQIQRAPDVATVERSTKAENFEHFKEIFADEEELLDLGRVSAIPASVEVEPAPGVDVADLEKRLRDEVPNVNAAQSMPCLPPRTR